MRQFSVLTTAIAISIVLLSTGGFAMAATTTNGSMTDSSSIVWTISSGGAIDNVLVPGEQQSTTVYGENTQASGGKSTYARSLNLDTGSKTFGQYNVDSLKMFTFDGNNSGPVKGRAISDEFIGIETMGMPGNASQGSCDPFASGTWPAYHNTVNAGSSFDLEQGAVLTQARTRTVTPRVDIPVVLDYQVGLQGLDNKPAVGAAGAFFDGHLEQGSGNSTEKSMDLVFSDHSTASGLIYRFDKAMNYESGSTISVF